MQANLHCKLAFIWERAAFGSTPQQIAATCSCSLCGCMLMAASATLPLKFLLNWIEIAIQFNVIYGQRKYTNIYLLLKQ